MSSIKKKIKKMAIMHYIHRYTAEVVKVLKKELDVNMYTWHSLYGPIFTTHNLFTSVETIISIKMLLQENNYIFGNLGNVCYSLYIGWKKM